MKPHRIFLFPTILSLPIFFFVSCSTQKTTIPPSQVSIAGYISSTTRSIDKITNRIDTAHQNPLFLKEIREELMSAKTDLENANNEILLLHKESTMFAESFSKLKNENRNLSHDLNKSLVSLGRWKLATFTTISFAIPLILGSLYLGRYLRWL